MFCIVRAQFYVCIIFTALITCSSSCILYAFQWHPPFQFLNAAVLVRVASVAARLQRRQ